jgi:hypothetical protein
MSRCDECGRQENMPYQCRYCGGTFCGEHRLPENHACTGLENWNDPGGVFDSGFDDSVDEGSRGGLLQRVAGTGGPLGYFRGNMTFVFLGLMLLTFVLQYAIAPLFGAIPPQPGLGTGNELWESLFLLTTENPLYVWTWVTSVFSHGGFVHIFGNGIALFFFGPIVERRVGSKAFTALFLVSGMAAGLGQVGLSLALGNPTAVLGASGAVMAIMAVLTVLNPDLRVYLYFILPVPIWVLTIGFAGLSVVGALSPTTNVLGGNIAHIAHLTGLVIGFVYGEYVKRQGVSAPRQLQLGGGGGGGRGPGGRGPF